MISIAMLVSILLVAGALNWGLVAYNGFDVVAYTTGGGMPERVVKYLVAVAGVIYAYNMVR
jgi:uncharacterized membrane protein YuzA (DUF378 family)